MPSARNVESEESALHGDSLSDPAHISVGRPPALSELRREARQRITRFIAASTLGGGAAPTEIIALYADLAGDADAIRYVDQRFVVRGLPLDWRDMADRVLDIEEAARARGVDLAAAWRRARDVAPGFDETDPLEDLVRLAGAPAISRTGTSRSIFDDPEDIEALEAEDGPAVLHEPMTERLPELVDLSPGAQLRLRRFAIEERLEHGLAPIELLELYRVVDVAGDQRAHQYLDRVFVERDPPADWLDLQTEAQRVMDLAHSRGRDAGRIFATLSGGNQELDPLGVLQMVVERLRLGQA